MVGKSDRLETTVVIDWLLEPLLKCSKGSAANVTGWFRSAMAAPSSTPALLESSAPRNQQSLSCWGGPFTIGAQVFPFMHTIHALQMKHGNDEQRVGQGIWVLRSDVLFDDFLLPFQVLALRLDSQTVVSRLESIGLTC